MRKVAITEAFDRRLFRFLKQHGELKKKVVHVFRMLENDLDSQALNTHKLHGKMGNSYACNINYHYRIVFTFDDKYVYPKSIGSHDDVY